MSPWASAPQDCRRCPPLVESRTRVVNGEGSCSSGLMLLGEAPGRREDERGEPFVGRSGEVLDEALTGLGLDRDDVRISNVVRCRPPGNRDPLKSEVGNCRSYLVEEVSVFEPGVVCALGRVASSALLGRAVSMGEALGRGGGASFGELRVPLVVNYHPAATLYDPSKRVGFDDALETAIELLD
ncbi:MAG: Type-4 uracil-DNA glycosylase [Methanonatronarchaeales archaeon]|nr:Type-4 uracil-DNA glycosylase [Methanonatronarchaeales archaeon]